MNSQISRYEEAFTNVSPKTIVPWENRPAPKKYVYRAWKDADGKNVSAECFNFSKDGKSWWDVRATSDADNHIDVLGAKNNFLDNVCDYIERMFFTERVLA